MLSSQLAVIGPLYTWTQRTFFCSSVSSKSLHRLFSFENVFIRC